MDIVARAREIFAETLAGLDAGAAVRSLARFADGALWLDEWRCAPPVYAVALGKAAGPMAQALDEVLGPILAGGVLSSPLTGNLRLTGTRWRVFAGGHPIPNEASLQAAQAALALLRQAETERARVIFLVSGGGSALLEWPVDESLTLDDLIAANRILVNCGAPIAEINAVRRAWSAVKGGGLARVAPKSDKLTLIVSDTNPGDESSVASGPTLEPRSNPPDVAQVLARYDLLRYLPPRVTRVLENYPLRPLSLLPLAPYKVLLDQDTSLRAAAECAQKKGFKLAMASDIREQPVTVGAALLVNRLRAQCQQAASDNAPVVVGVVSAGEFACPVRGNGQGGRSTETALLLALELQKTRAWWEAHGWQVAALCAGTDGIDGNSPAAGALATPDTIARANARGLKAEEFLRRSDTYNFFAALDDTIITGPTGTNVRDLRIMLARRGGT